VLLAALDVFDWREALQWARGLAQHGWFAAGLIALQVVLYAFALPGSGVVWLAAPLYAPPAATAILTAGASLGALAAYLLARRMTARARERLEREWLYRVLAARADFLALLALRLLPGFPHSVLNYGAGVLRVPLALFFGAALAGFAVKSWLYATVIHAAAEREFREFARADTVLALAALCALAFLGRALRRRLSSRRS
jgi:uncharacterized membrane protein YdjX (TVP38/TMEM64 family)